MSMRLVGQWTMAKRLVGGIGKNAQRAIDMTVAQEAMLFRKMVNDAFVDGGPPGKKWKKLSALTLQLRRSMKKINPKAVSRATTKPLISSGSLRGSINVRRMGHAKYFVGVHRNTRRKGGGPPMVNIARVHELGAVIPVTDRMRKFFMYLVAKGIIERPLSYSTHYIIIPQRSFLAATFDKFKRGNGPRSIDRFRENLLKLAGGK